MTTPRSKNPAVYILDVFDLEISRDAMAISLDPRDGSDVDVIRGAARNSATCFFNASSLDVRQDTMATAIDPRIDTAARIIITLSEILIIKFPSKNIEKANCILVEYRDNLCPVD